MQTNRLLLAFVFFVPFVVSLNSCASARPDPSIYTVGAIEVRLYQNRSALARDLQITPVAIGNRTLEIHGYYDRAENVIYSIDDARVLLHEVKHFLDPNWVHPLGQSGVDP